jgi:hypothetical protein
MLMPNLSMRGPSAAGRLSDRSSPRNGTIALLRETPVSASVEARPNER